MIQGSAWVTYSTPYLHSSNNSTDKNSNLQHISTVLNLLHPDITHHCLGMFDAKRLFIDDIKARFDAPQSSRKLCSTLIEQHLILILKNIWEESDVTVKENLSTIKYEWTTRCTTKKSRICNLRQDSQVWFIISGVVTNFWTICRI